MKSLFIALDYSNGKKKEQDRISLNLYLTDDGCSDGTAAAVMEEFAEREVQILQGNGHLYWAGGMRFAWNEALKGDYDFYLLLNDDTVITEDVFEMLFEANEYCLKLYKKEGIYSGCTSSTTNSQNITYGGDVWINRFYATSKRLAPNGTPQLCDVANANILLISKSVVSSLGIFCNKYTHAIADYDYTLKAGKKGIPVLITSGICGRCDQDHSFDYNQFAKLDYSKRKQYLDSPLGSAKDYLFFIRKNFIIRYPMVYFGYVCKLFFPKLYVFLDKKRY